MPEQPCAFHPDRLTGVSCSRCDRPICPEDMIDAPVGIHCPICAGRMREGALGQTAYRVRTRAERTPVARMAARWSIANLIMAVNVGIFILMYLTGRPTATTTLLRFGALYPGLPSSQWWRLITSTFVHIGPLHLMFNMYALYLFGSAMELRHGKLRMLALYLSSGFLASATSLVFNPGAVSAGASGAVFGIFGAHIAFFGRHHTLPGARQQLKSMLVLVGINMAIGVAVPGIDWVAHLGGLAGGLVIGFGLEFAGRARDARRFLAPGAYLLVLVVAVVLANRGFGHTVLYG
jgi:membrane associated rhomboid family serine protease